MVLQSELSPMLFAVAKSTNLVYLMKMRMPVLMMMTMTQWTLCWEAYHDDDNEDDDCGDDDDDDDEGIMMMMTTMTWCV